LSSDLQIIPPNWYNPFIFPMEDIVNHRELNITKKMLKRFWSKVEMTDGCWTWKAFKNKQGYGRFGIAAGQCVNAHRVSYTIKNGPIPQDLFICHTCDNPSCVNPNHLFAGSRQDNIDDMMIKKRSRHFNNHEFYGVQKEDRAPEGPNRKARWRSFYCKEGKMIMLGHHNSLIEAARNHDRIAYIVFGERKLLNFPDEYNITHWS